MTDSERDEMLVAQDRAWADHLAEPSKLSREAKTNIVRSCLRLAVAHIKSIEARLDLKEARLMVDIEATRAYTDANDDVPF